MPTDHRALLAGVRRFDQLIAYLRDEMGWPIGSDDFEDLTFEYTPEELGIDAKSAAKIQEIRRLRPGSPSQPWGIFFVKFEPKRLPVVALRRILGQVALKRRASANSTERQAWAADDLLFISNYGEGGERRISFAHFAKPRDSHDLPTLNVLGWDNLDTALHLDDVAEKLTKDLAWPDDDSDADAWRERWRAAFTLRHRETITTSRDLSLRLAELARAIRDRIQTALAIETENGPLTKLLKAFQDALLHDLDAASFADMYAQTIAYGLLSARITDPEGKAGDDLAAHLRTTPFLKELLETFLHVRGRQDGGTSKASIDFDELGVSEVIDLLGDTANMPAIVRDFGDRTPEEDPVIHFYELFLAAYDKRQKVQRGVFYTPRPVVSYVVRSVDELLRAEFGLEDGLADTTTWGEIVNRRKDLAIPKGVSADQAFVQILDPATGTGTFLIEVIDRIFTTMTERWKVQGHDAEEVRALWNEYVPDHLLPRLHGYELLMAPYAIAHLKIGLKLYETGYRFGSAERARVFLTNALEPPADEGQQALTGILPALAYEAQAVGDIKRAQRFTVVIGNPPYSGLSSNMGPWIDGLLKGHLPDDSHAPSYYQVDGHRLGERKLWLQDDYVKFLRLSQWLLDSTGCGVHGYITNHGYLDNPTFRGMRWSLMQSFDSIYVLDLHGNVKKKEVAPSGRRDVNVFDIQQGVAIGMFVKQGNRRTGPDQVRVRHGKMWGDRQTKYERLLAETVASTAWQQIDSAGPFYLFILFDRTVDSYYYGWSPINDIMPVNVTGLVTARDDFVIDFDEASLLQRISALRDTSISDEDIRREYFAGKGSKKYPPGDSRGWKLPAARSRVRADADWRERSAPILYRPFDRRQIYYVPWMVDWPRTEAMPHMLASKNIGLIYMRQVAQGDSYSHFGVTRELVDNRAFYSNKGIMNVGPLYLYPGVGKEDLALFSEFAAGPKGRLPNLKPEFVEALEDATDLSFVSDRAADRDVEFDSDEVLGFIYGVFHSPEYRRRFDAPLKLDFPRVPPPGDRRSFQALARLGRELIALHLLESGMLGTFMTTYAGPRNPKVGRVGWADGCVWLDAGKTSARAGHRATAPGTIGVEGVPEEVWDFHVGGYQVCHKWLKDRKGRTLADDDLAHYQKIIVALSETIRLMKEIDEVIESHGGWPGAFQTTQ